MLPPRPLVRPFLVLAASIVVAALLVAQDKGQNIPLDEMSATDRYQGEAGGLYGKGQNRPPEAHARAAEEQLKKIEPLDANGKPSPDGKSVLVSISMSNATQEFSVFKQIADKDSRKSPKLTIVDCAQGGQAMAEWAAPDARPWQVALQRLQAAGVSPNQVQVAWVKLANKGPTGKLRDHGRALYADTQEVLTSAKSHFPNLQIAYLGSRIYAGYTNSRLNPEPYAYESAFVARWLILNQIDEDPSLSYSGDKTPVPLLLWGPYLWANGQTPRKSDGLVWLEEDFERDFTHPSRSGREKVAKLLLEFFANDPLAKTWFAK